MRVSKPHPPRKENMNADYEDLSKYCRKGRQLRQEFDELVEPVLYRKRIKAYFEHVRDCPVCHQADFQLLNRHARIRAQRAKSGK